MSDHPVTFVNVLDVEAGRQAAGHATRAGAIATAAPDLFTVASEIG
jgi:hypothetical protein